MAFKIGIAWPPLRCTKFVLPLPKTGLWELTDDLRRTKCKAQDKENFKYVSLVSALNISALTFVFFNLLPGISWPSGCNVVTEVVLFK